MLLNYLLDFWYCLPLLVLMVVFCAGNAYRINARRAAEDPNKRDFHIGAILLTMFTPVLLPLYIGLWLLRAIVFAIGLIVVTVGLVIIRKPFIVPWLEKISMKLGNKLLALNTAVINTVLGKETKEPPS